MSRGGGGMVMPAFSALPIVQQLIIIFCIFVFIAIIVMMLRGAWGKNK